MHVTWPWHVRAGENKIQIVYSAVGCLKKENTTNENQQWWKVRAGIYFALTAGSQVVNDENQ